MKTKEEIRQIMKENGYEEISGDEWRELEDEGEVLFYSQEGDIYFKPKPRKAKEGDFIEIDDCLCLLVYASNWLHNNLKGDLAVVLLKYNIGNDWMKLADSYQMFFEQGKYKIITREEALRRLGE